MFIIGIDRLERLKGIPLKLLAIEKLLQENSIWRDKVIFIIIGISAGEKQADYKSTQLDVNNLVKKINATYSINENSPVIHFEERPERNISLPQRLAFFAAADILMSIATRY